MPKYFLGDTRLAGMERMMMDPSRSESSREKPRQKGRQQKGRQQKSHSQTNKAAAFQQMNMEGCV